MKTHAHTPSTAPHHHRPPTHQRPSHAPNQATHSNQALQAKLRIGPQADPMEREADRVADQVMRMPDPAVRLKPT